MDNRQFRAIVDAYADMVYRIALNQTRRGADADDVVQAVFLKLYEKPPEWLGRASAAEQADGGRSLRSSRSAAPNAATDERLRAWLIRVTVNECRNLWRALWHRRVELREVGDADTPPYLTMRSRRFRSPPTSGSMRPSASFPRSAASWCTCSTSRIWAPAR